MTPAQRLLLGGDGGDGTAANVGLLVLRLVAGLTLAFAHGLADLPPAPPLVEAVAGAGLPLPEASAWALGLVELGSGLLLALGLLTRPASLLLLLTTAALLLLGPAEAPLMDGETTTLFAGIAALFLLAGAGRFSLDAFIRGRKQERVVRRFVRG